MSTDRAELRDATRKAFNVPPATLFWAWREPAE